MASHLFISHSSQDDGDVKRLREILEAHGLTTWVDSRGSAGAIPYGPKWKLPFAAPVIFWWWLRSSPLHLNG
jgi:hypothetical protein